MNNNLDLTTTTIRMTKFLLNVPSSSSNGRGPYHALARENAEALNALLSHEISVMTRQLQQAMELMNQLIRRQLDD